MSGRIGPGYRVLTADRTVYTFGEEQSAPVGSEEKASRDEIQEALDALPVECGD